MEKKEMVYFDDLGKYLRFERDKRMSDCHIYMMWRVAEYLRNSRAFRNAGGVQVSFVAIPDLKTDYNYPDLYCGLFDVECETGLKHHYGDLKQRILNNPKSVIVVLPNQDVLKRYKKNCSVRKTHLFFCTLETFPKTMTNVLRPIQDKIKRDKKKHQLR